MYSKYYLEQFREDYRIMSKSFAIKELAEALMWSDIKWEMWQDTVIEALQLDKLDKQQRRDEFNFIDMTLRVYYYERVNSDEDTAEQYYKTIQDFYKVFRKFM